MMLILPLAFQVKFLAAFIFSSPPRACAALSMTALALSSAAPAGLPRPYIRTARQNALLNRVMGSPRLVRTEMKNADSPRSHHQSTCNKVLRLVATMSFSTVGAAARLNYNDLRWIQPLPPRTSPQKT